jgi:hypothetical protein
MRYLLILVLSATIGCGTDESTTSETSTEAHGSNPNPVLFPRDAHPFGRSMARWNERLWRWITAQPADHNPILDRTGADCAVDQNGPVWFLPSVIPDGRPFVASRNCTLPRHKAVLVSLASILNDYPCPDPSFQPAPGQTLYDFLVEGAAAFIDTVNLIEVSLDGVPLTNMLDYRYTSEDLFHFTGDPSLQPVLDGCITGERQPGVVDSYSIMFKPLDPGAHTLVWHLTDTFGMTGDTTLTYHLTVR